MYFVAVLVCVATALHSTDAFCDRLYNTPYWTPKSLSQRAADADIIIYGNVVESPCTKPIFVAQNFTTAPPVNATNSSSSVQQETPSSVNNITEGNTTDICLMRGLYNVTMAVSCVIKGGYVPYLIHLRSFGFGPDKCTYLHRGYNFMETVQSFHVYKGLNYLIFLGRWVWKHILLFILCSPILSIKIPRKLNFDCIVLCPSHSDLLYLIFLTQMCRL